MFLLFKSNFEIFEVELEYVAEHNRHISCLLVLMCSKCHCDYFSATFVLSLDFKAQLLKVTVH